MFFEQTIQGPFSDLEMFRKKIQGTQLGKIADSCQQTIK